MTRPLWSVPMITLGEFDALEGPKSISVSEYYAYQEFDIYGPQLMELSAVYGKSLLSSRVASGYLRPEYNETMKIVVAQVLGSNESSQESVIMLDPIAGGIASLSFCLRDILARGEERRFCMIVTHPQSDELIRQWPILYCFLKILLNDWIILTKERRDLEYSTVGDLDKRRAEAGTFPTRSLMKLLAQNTESEDIAFKKVHTFFECTLPAVFSLEPLKIDKPYSETLLINEVKRYLNVKIPLIWTTDIDIKSSIEEGIFIPVGSGRILGIGKLPKIKPLSVWLLQFIQRSTKGILEVDILLRALFSGTQIIIYGENSFHCANLAISLSQILPRPLRCVTVFAKEYMMPYKSRILSFSQSISQRWYIDNLHEEQIKLLKSKLVCVNVDSEGFIVSVNEYNKFISSVVDSGNNSSPRVEKTTNPTIVIRIIDLLHSQISTKITLCTCKVLQIHIEEIVNEYIMRGQVYLRLFRKHEMSCNQEVLGLNNSAENSKSSFIGLNCAFKHLFSKYLSYPDSQASSVLSNTEYGVITKSNNSSLLKSLKGTNLETWVNLSADHDILLFLGSVSAIL